MRSLVSQRLLTICCRKLPLNVWVEGFEPSKSHAPEACMLTGLHHTQQEVALLMLTLPNELLQRVFALSEWQGSNLRPQHPKCRALSTALHPVFSHTIVEL